MDASVSYSLAFYADVARRAASEAEGVVGTAHDPLLGLIGRVRKGYSRGGVKVHRAADGAILMEVGIVVRYGSDLVDVVHSVQGLVIERLTMMSGLPPKQVTVSVRSVAERK